MRLLIIANPAAGGGRGVRLLPHVEAFLRKAGHQVQSHISQSAEHLAELTGVGIAQGVDVIVAYGGDGTVHVILQKLVFSDVALGLIPAGRGNDLAANLGISTDYRMACQVLAQGKAKTVDVAKVTNGGRAGRPSHWPPVTTPAPIYYVNVAGAGFDAEVNRRVNQNPFRLYGRAAYPGAVLGALSKFRPRQMEIEWWDGRPARHHRFSGVVMLVAVGNARSYGGGLKIVPHAELDDGWLDLCIVKKTSKFELLRNLPRLYKGTHTSHPAVEIHRARRVTLSSVSHIELFGDGEYLQDLPAIIEVVPRAVRVIAPYS